MNPNSSTWARLYRDLGMQVFPCEGKRPTRAKTWPNDTPFQPGDNIGMVAPKNCVIVDCDIKNGTNGWETLLALAPEKNGLWAAPRAKTGSGGKHLFFRAPPLLEIGNHRGNLPDGIDIRGNGRGYVIVAPSKHPETGELYQWETPLVPVAEMPLLPDWLLKLILPPRQGPQRPAPGPRDYSNYIEAAIRGEEKSVRAAGKGSRNEALNRAAYALGTLEAAGLDRDTAMGVLVNAALDIGLRQREANDTFNSGWRAGVANPRNIPDTETPNRHIQPVATSSRSPNWRQRGHGRDVPTIAISTSERAVNDAAISALAAAKEGDIYTRAQQLVRVIAASRAPAGGKLYIPDEATIIRPLDQATLRERMADAGRWVRVDAEGKEKPAHPPQWSVNAVLKRASYPGVPAVRGIANYPMLRPDNTVACCDGYDRQTGFYLSGVPSSLRPPGECARADAEISADLLLNMIADFPMRSDTDKSAWLAYLLTPIARAVISGPTPLFLVQANVRGSGKTLLADAAGIILTGNRLPSQTYSPEQAELEKVLVSVAVLGLPILCFDNVAGSVGGSVLDKWITSIKPTGRILGQSQITTFDWQTVLVATGNNASVYGDTDRRAIYVTLESEHERPELRTDFENPDLHDYLKRHRTKALQNALTILVAHAQAGRPSMGGIAKGGFESWCGVVRDAVMFAGLPDCERDADDEGRPVDAEMDELGVLLHGLHECFGDTQVTVGEILAEAYDRELAGPGSKALKNALAMVATKGDRPTAKGLGWRLRRYKNRRKGGLILRSHKDHSSNSQRWSVSRLTND